MDIYIYGYIYMDLYIYIFVMSIYQQYMQCIFMYIHYLSKITLLAPQELRRATERLKQKELQDPRWENVWVIRRGIQWVYTGYILGIYRVYNGYILGI